MKINCDYGESFGRYSLAENKDILKYIDMVNVACGFHAGDPVNMQKTLINAMENQVSIGAHPSYYDLRGFGRTPMDVAGDVLYADIIYQLAAIDGMLRTLGGKLHHVKPHGALYNQCASNEKVAKTVLKAIKDFDESLLVVGLSGSDFLRVAQEMSLSISHEVFADRQYHQDGKLVSRQLEGAVFHSIEEMVKQSTRFNNGSGIVTRENTKLVLSADTLCIHGDGEHALSIAKALRDVL